MEPLVSAINGDLNAWNRLAANSIRGWIPQSSALGVLSDAISETQKDIQGEMHEYVMNRLPGLSGLLADQVDFWTGDPLNQNQNLIGKALNAINPLKVNEGAEPWRIWLHKTGWTGHSKLNKDSTGSYTYSTKERELIMKFMGEDKLFKRLQSFMKSKKFNNQLDILRTHRHREAGLDDDRLRLKVMDLPVNQAISALVRESQQRAEIRLATEYPKIANIILLNKAAKNQMRQGNVPKAINIQKKEQETRQLINMAK